LKNPKNHIKPKNQNIFLKKSWFFPPLSLSEWTGQHGTVARYYHWKKNKKCRYNEIKVVTERQPILPKGNYN
jgi:hypothetical protein